MDVWYIALSLPVVSLATVGHRVAAGRRPQDNIGGLRPHVCLSPVIREPPNGPA